MLALAPDAALVKGSYCYLPLHIAAHFNNIADAIESLMNAYPRTLLEKDDNGYYHIVFLSYGDRGDELKEKIQRKHSELLTGVYQHFRR
mmetsp:Transcript_1746/g.2331  ORF Transcript_1746/g.2331 Transcript_1746/m.2331 type:complete len:89 (-) Transcript_1746:802-1068(-)